jgi:hypothetical protein
LGVQQQGFVLPGSARHGNKRHWRRQVGLGKCSSRVLGSAVLELVGFLVFSSRVCAVGVGWAAARVLVLWQQQGC